MTYILIANEVYLNHKGFTSGPFHRKYYFGIQFFIVFKTNLC